MTDGRPWSATSAATGTEPRPHSDEADTALERRRRPARSDRSRAAPAAGSGSRAAEPRGGQQAGLGASPRACAERQQASPDDPTVRRSVAAVEAASATRFRRRTRLARGTTAAQGRPAAKLRRHTARVRLVRRPVEGPTAARRRKSAARALGGRGQDRQPGARVTRASGSAVSSSTGPRSRARPSAPPTVRADPRGPSPARPTRPVARGDGAGRPCRLLVEGATVGSGARTGSSVRGPAPPVAQGNRPPGHRAGLPGLARLPSGGRPAAARSAVASAAPGAFRPGPPSLSRPLGREANPFVGGPHGPRHPLSVREARLHHGRRSRPRDRWGESRPGAARAGIDGSLGSRFGPSAAGDSDRRSRRRAAPSPPPSDPGRTSWGEVGGGEAGCAPSHGPRESGSPRISRRGADRGGLRRRHRGRGRAPGPDDRAERGTGGGIAPPRDRRLGDGSADRRRPVELGAGRTGPDRGGSRSEPLRESVGRTRRVSTSVARGPGGSVASRRSGLVLERGRHGRRDRGGRKARLGPNAVLRASERPGDPAA